ncbi:RNA polymerase sigma factor [Microbispora sp. NPDC049125]|uniref:RNA polymerase sigma factor n=1 Tax=Microbispora sp. NPDC049125 TaxID=3154929 RepID=UPI0034662605
MPRSEPSWDPHRRERAQIDLVRAAQQGDPQSLGLLLKLNRGAMYAVAYGILGNGADAEDACQDAAVTAISRLADLRDPAAAGSWLKAIVRNTCRMRLRSRLPVPVGLPDESIVTGGAGDPAEVIERQATRDWIWSGLMSLSPTVREVAILRYFTQVNSYQEIARACGVPVGTVRSRLARGRGERSMRRSDRWSASEAILSWALLSLRRGPTFRLGILAGLVRRYQVAGMERKAVRIGYLAYRNTAGYATARQTASAPVAKGIHADGTLGGPSGDLRARGGGLPR